MRHNLEVSRRALFCLLALWLTVAEGSLLAQQAKPSASRPNIVVILADDLGWGDLGCYSADSKIPTPRIDALAKAGTRFVDAHSPSSVCTPTRYGVLTGRYAWRTRLKSGVLNGYSPALVENDRLTIPSLAKRHGYNTACIGKWHLGLGTQQPVDFSQELSPGPRTVGFDESFIHPASLDMPPYVFVENERAVPLPNDKIAASEMRRYGGKGYWREGAIAPGFKHVDTLPKLAERANEFLSKQTPDKPFLLYFPLTGPHTPWMPTKEFEGHSKVGFYGDFLMQVDATVGKLLDVLEERKLAENTLVIFTSDNGAHWLSTDIDQWHHRSNANWRGMKADLWEGGHRIPLIVRWPGHVAENRASEQLICLTDILATLAEVTGDRLSPNEAEDSYSFLSAMASESTGAPQREAIVHQASDGTFAVREGTWKLATKLGSHGFSEPKNVVPESGGPAGQLYNLADDPGETRNLWLDQPEIVERLSKLLADYQRQGSSRPLEP